MVKMTGHDWKFKYCHPHNGEYWYECTRCGAADWVARADHLSGQLHMLKPTKEICVPKALHADVDLDLDDVAATSPKAKAELEALRNKIVLLEQELDAYQTDHSHQCIVCRHCYTPQQDESEDCPVCGCDGTKGY